MDSVWPGPRQKGIPATGVAVGMRPTSAVKCNSYPRSASRHVITADPEEFYEYGDEMHFTCHSRQTVDATALGNSSYNARCQAYGVYTEGQMLPWCSSLQN